MTDREWLENFAALVRTQKPAETLWEPVTDYSFEARRLIEGEHPDRIIQAFGKVPMLDFGCGPDAILVRLLRERGVMAYGIDPTLRRQWRAFEPNDEDEDDISVIICREVFEHNTVSDIQSLIVEFSTYRTRYIYVTTRFHPSPQHLLDVATSDDLDPTHITLLNQDFLRLLFVLEGFKQRADLEAILDWQQKGRVLVYERV